MADIGTFEEWRTRNSQRRYPFADDALLMDTVSGHLLADDVFVDAMFYPINIMGSLYLSGISLSESKLQVSDSNGMVAAASLDCSETGAFNFYDIYGRLTGILVPGPGFAAVAGDMAFTRTAASFAQACVAPQAYSCLSGVLLPDGTFLGGQIYWAGENGIQVTTEYIDGTPVIRIDAVGVSAVPACLNLGPPVTCINVQQTGTGGALMISQTENMILLATPYMLQDSCAAAQTLPDSGGNLPMPGNSCTPVPPVPCTPPAPSPMTGCPSQPYSAYYILPMTDTIGISLVTQPAAVTQESLELSALGGSFDLPPRPRQGLKLYLKGNADAST